MKLRLYQEPLSLAVCPEESSKGRKRSWHTVQHVWKIGERPVNGPCYLALVTPTWTPLCLQILLIPGVVQIPLPPVALCHTRC